MVTPVENRKNVLRWQKKYPERVNAKNKKWADSNKEKIQAKRRRQRYGLLQSEFELMMKSQNNKCALCHQEFGTVKSQSPSVDHNHKTMKIRGILCDRCNRLLGVVDDNIEIFKLAIEYLLETNN